MGYFFAKLGGYLILGQNLKGFGYFFAAKGWWSIVPPKSKKFGKNIIYVCNFVPAILYGLLASYDESKGFPQNFSDCVANFCDPPAWEENLMYDDYEKRHTKTCPDVIKMQKETFMVQIEHALKFNLPFVKLTLIILRQLCVAQHLFQ